MPEKTFAAQSKLAEFPVALDSRSLPAVPQQARQSFREGMAHLQSGNAGEAVAVLSRSIELAPDFPEGHLFLGIAQALTSDIYPAIDHLEEAAKLAPDSFAPHYTLAQLHFKLRTPGPGYEAAERALKCVETIEQRKMLAQLLKEERARERSGIARPSFAKPFGRPILFIAGSVLAAAIILAMTYMR